MAVKNKKVTTEFEVEVITGGDVQSRICDFCRQSGRKILIRGTNDDDRDICGECIKSFAALVKEHDKSKAVQG